MKIISSSLIICSIIVPIRVPLLVPLLIRGFTALTLGLLELIEIT
jgi:hypothetical protein